MLAVLVDLRQWREECVHRRVCVAIDNEAARAALVNYSSSAPALRAIVNEICHLDAKHPAYRWYIRVPSSSNLADRPSRLDTESLSRERAVRRRLDWRKLSVHRFASA